MHRNGDNHAGVTLWKFKVLSSSIVNGEYSESWNFKAVTIFNSAVGCEVVNVILAAHLLCLSRE
jgi:hypothetical protein